MTLVKHSTEYFQALDAFLAERQARPFAWGEQDCCTFAADWMQLVRGNDPMEGLRGLATARQALEVIESMGGMRNAVESRLGASIPGAMAQVGDVAIVVHGERRSMGICIGPGIAVPGDDGLAVVMITQAEAAWRV